ncbi:DoxX family protein [Chryseolinea soli]|uniref:DoxX family protein n=1 Tax=Chryseolinea soli TaxID=2321403 RepID=A0A385T001_9BACT|nr:DoxX family protein [Chryseolinea soli]
MSQKATAITGWILTILLAFLFSMSALMKLTLNETGLVQASALGIEAGTFRMIGVIEILSVILFVVPRTGVAGALLLIAYMGGAIATHVQHQQSVAGVVLIEVLIWLTASLRFPELGRRLIRYGEKNLG